MKKNEINVVWLKGRLKELRIVAFAVYQSFEIEKTETGFVLLLERQTDVDNILDKKKNELAELEKEIEAKIDMRVK